MQCEHECGTARVKLRSAPLPLLHAVERLPALLRVLLGRSSLTRLYPRPAPAHHPLMFAPPCCSSKDDGSDSVAAGQRCLHLSLLVVRGSTGEWSPAAPGRAATCCCLRAKSLRCPCERFGHVIGVSDPGQRLGSDPEALLRSRLGEASSGGRVRSGAACISVRSRLPGSSWR